MKLPARRSLLLMLLVVALVPLTRSLWSTGARLEKLPEPATGKLEARPRADIQDARDAAAAILSQSAAPAARRAAAYGQLGKVYLVYGLADPAAACFRNAAALEPLAAQWPYFLARSLALAGRDEAASSAMTSALERMAKDPAGSLRDRVPAWCFLAESALRLNRIDEARRHLQTALEAVPRAPFPLLRLGQLAARAGDHGRAAGYYERALASLPTRPDLSEWVAAQPKSAASAGPLPPSPISYADPLSSSLSELDHSSAGLLRLGIEHTARGRRRRALDAFRQAVEANPELVAARAFYAEALLDAGDGDRSRQEAAETLRRDPANRRARGTLARAYAASPATRDEGIALAAALRREQPGRPEPLLLLGAVCSAAGRYADSLAAYRQAAALAPRQPAPRLGEAAMLAALGRYAAARDAYETAATAFSGNPGIRLAFARFLVTAPDRAARDPRRGLELSRQLLSSGDTLARSETVAVALAANDRFPAAAAAVTRLLRRDDETLGPAARLRLQQMLRAFESRRPWTEPWPFHSSSTPE